MEHRIEHDLSPELARKAVQSAIENYRERFAKYQVEAAWQTGDEVRVGFNAKGAKLSGQVKLVPHAIVIDMDVPFLLRPFRGKALEVIELQVQKWIEKARSGQL
jgi:hypothetical protein